MDINVIPNIIILDVNNNCKSYSLSMILTYFKSTVMSRGPACRYSKKQKNKFLEKCIHGISNIVNDRTSFKKTHINSVKLVKFI